MSLIAELSRRNVFRATIAYLVAGWLLVEVGDVVLNTFGAPAWVLKTVIALLLLGLPAVVFFSWAFEVTPEGIRREKEVPRDQSITRITGRKLDRTIIILLVIALGYFAFDKFVLAPGRQPAMVEATSPTATAAPDQIRTEPPAIQPATPLPPDNSIAVLPFVDLSPEADQAYFSDGLSEELLNLLVKVPELQVAARTSSFSFKGENLEIPEIARRLNVAHVLEGSVRKAGNRVRITAQLVKGGDGYHLWSETYDRTLDDIFAIQEQIAAAVVDELKVQLLGAAPSAVETDPQGYSLYLQARQVGRLSSAESLERSNELYQRVLEIDPGYAPAWDGLAANYLQQIVIGEMAPADGAAPVRQAVDRTLEIDPQIATAYAIQGQIAILIDDDLAAAAGYIERAVNLEPGNIEVLRAVLAMERALGRLDQALTVSEYMVRLDPVNNNAWYSLAIINRYLGNYEQVISGMQRALDLSPDRSGAWALIAEAQVLSGMPEAALESIGHEESVWHDITLPMIYDALNRRADADAALDKLIREQSEVSAYNIAYLYAYRGEADKAFEWLEHAIETNDPGVTDIMIENLFAPIHDDPRWLPLLQRLGKTLAQLGAIKFEFALPD